MPLEPVYTAVWGACWPPNPGGRAADNHDTWEGSVGPCPGRPWGHHRQGCGSEEEGQARTLRPGSQAGIYGETEARRWASHRVRSEIETTIRNGGM